MTRNKERPRKKAARRGTHASILAATSLGMLVLSGAFALLFISPFAIWRLERYLPINVWVVDKTVPTKDYREHRGLFWIMQHLKISKPGSRILYRENIDYYGFYPASGKEWAASPMPERGVKPDLIYLADTYGVYEEDLMQRRLSGEFSPKLYGGLSDEDTRAISNALGAGNTLIAEFNVAASPTNEINRRTLGQLLGVTWVGWIGKYYEDLGDKTAVPPWMIRLYQEQKKTDWKFNGRGYVMLKDDDRIEVFTEGRDVSPRGLKIEFSDSWKKRIGVRAPISFRQYFEVIKVFPGGEQIAEYSMDLTPEGRARFDELGIPAKFPAAVKFENAQYDAWYFAGDFAELALSPLPYQAVGINRLKAVLADDTVDDYTYFYWKAYVPLMTRIFKDIKGKQSSLQYKRAHEKIDVPVKAYGLSLKRRNASGVYEDFFVRGVNMGLAEPGKYFTDFPDDIPTFRRWFDQIADMNANTIRSYTLPPPEFYRALDAHNRENPGKVLYLLQEIWPEEHPRDGDYLAEDYRQSFQREIDFGVDAVYGRANIPERKGRAWGMYNVDVSPWLLGWLVGRELESEEVMATDARNKGAIYSGRFVSAVPGASPTEAWLAESMDTVASIEADRYGVLHPVSIVSWPTLDPKEHDSEWDPVTGKKNRWNDRASVAIANFDVTAENQAGLFGSYHIYPNYPDFMNNELAYGNYRDEEGVLRYGGYLREFKASHGKFPALVAEYGLANGTSIAHYAPDGLHHGGIDEKAAGEGILRMERALRREGYAGGVVFEWMDEWVKKTWTTEYLMIPYERHVLWHNVADPEQNYGLMANDPVPPSAPGKVLSGTGIVESVELSADAAWFHAKVKLSRPLADGRETLYLGFDTFARDLGEFRWPAGGLGAASGMEFMLETDGYRQAGLKVIPGYDSGNYKYQSTKSETGTFIRMQPLVNGPVTTRDGRRIEGRKFDASAMIKGEFDESRNAWKSDGRTLEFRIPWTRLNVTDPSSLRVLQDDRTTLYTPAQDQLRTVETEGFVVSALVWDSGAKAARGGANGAPSDPYRWQGWEAPPEYRERLKKSYDVLKNAWAKPVVSPSISGK